jgi:hypothetical protein
MELFVEFQTQQETFQINKFLKNSFQILLKKFSKWNIQPMQQIEQRNHNTPAIILNS